MYGYKSKQVPKTIDFSHITQRLKQTSSLPWKLSHGGNYRETMDFLHRKFQQKGGAMAMASKTSSTMG